LEGTLFGSFGLMDVLLRLLISQTLTNRKLEMVITFESYGARAWLVENGDLKVDRIVCRDGGGIKFTIIWDSFKLP
jgi:hypothetical protein